MTYRFKDIDFPDKETAMKWWRGVQAGFRHQAYCRAHPSSPEEWAELRRRTEEWMAQRPVNPPKTLELTQAQRDLCEALWRAGMAEDSVTALVWMLCKSDEATADLARWIREDVVESEMEILMKAIALHDALPPEKQTATCPGIPTQQPSKRNDTAPHRFKGIDFPDRKTAMAWEANNRKVEDHIVFSRANPLPEEEWKEECRRVREYGTGKPRVVAPAPVVGGDSAPANRRTRSKKTQDAEAQRLLAETSALAGEVEGEVQESTRNRAKEREATAKLIAYAKEHGLWNGDLEGSFDAKYGTGDGEKNTEGGEAIVWFDRTRGVAVKAIGLDYYGSPALALDRIALHNRYFPSVPLSLVGFGEVKDLFDAKGELELRGRPFNTVVEQPIVDRTRELTRSEIRFALEALGFRLVRDRRVLGADMETPDGKAVVCDLHEQNVFGLPDGSIAVIDCDIRAKDGAFTASGNPQSEPDRNRPGHHVQRNGNPKQAPSSTQE